MIKFVYLDVGGVALLDFSGTTKWDEMLTDIGIKNKDFEKFYKYYKNLGERQNLDLDVDSLMLDIEKKFDIKFKNEYSFLIDGFVKRFQKNVSINIVVSEIKKTCKIGLLTNMYPRMFKEIKKANLLPDVKWDIVIDSSIEMVQKPNNSIYKLAENKCGFSGNQILFVDNTQKHLEGSRKLGWLTFLYDPTNPMNSSKKLLKYFRENV